MIETGEDDAELFREELARYARNKRTRLLGFPRDWRPQSIVNPGSGLPFTDAGAWLLISELFLSDEKVEIVSLNKPPGQRAFVIKHKIHPERPRLYIKVHFGNGKVIGRSFHYSEITDSNL